MPNPKPILISITTTLYLSLILLHTHFSIINGVVVVTPSSSLDPFNKTVTDLIPSRNCSENPDGCVTEPEPESMEEEEEISRRLLVLRRKYLSYETLKRDMVPCGRPGASYYACHAPEANPYSRGCEVITRCARGIFDTQN